MAAPDLTVIWPVYGNQAHLRALHARMTAVLTEMGLIYELIAVHDASPDRSLDTLLDLVEADPRLRVLDLANNVGQNRAVLISLSHAQGRRALVMDADLQDPPEALPALWQALQPPYAAVFAGRRGQYESPWRLLTSRGIKWLLHWLSLGRLPPDAGLFVLMEREMIDRLCGYVASDPYVVGLMARANLPLISVPVARQPNPLGQTGYTLRARLRLAIRALIMLFKPMASQPPRPRHEPGMRVYEHPPLTHQSRRGDNDSANMTASTGTKT